MPNKNTPNIIGWLSMPAIKNGFSNSEYRHTPILGGGWMKNCPIREIRISLSLKIFL